MGAWCKIPSFVSAEFISAEGFEYVCVDMQHGAIGYTSAVSMFMAISSRGVTPIVRVPSNDEGEIMRMLDVGALGVVVPMVGTAADAARAVAACRYPPAGRRSYGPVRAALTTGTKVPQELEQVACVVMVETAEGLANIDSIAATPGVDVVYVGPADLALALGLRPGADAGHERLTAAIAGIKHACDRHGVVAGMHCNSGAVAHAYRSEGYRMVTIGDDAAFMTAAASVELARARGALVPAD